MQAIIDRKVRPMLQAHNGFITLQEVTPGGVVKVKLTGACATCPGARQTLSEIVETALKEGCPDIKGVVPVFAASEELLAQARRLLNRDRS